jgi:hypothetical protein
MRLAATDTSTAVKREDVKPVNKVKTLPVNHGVSFKTAATRYVIVRSILRYHVNAEKYTELYSRIFWVAEIGLPITGRLLRTRGYTYCELNDVMYNLNDKSGLGGSEWISAMASECDKRKN